MMDLIIRQIDVWLFRDGRPFFAGEDHDVTTIFPPTPFTLQGAIRTKVLMDKGVDLIDFAKQKNPDNDVGYGDNFGKLQLVGPMLVRKKDEKWERLIPMPSDVVEVKKEMRVEKEKEVKKEIALLKPEKLSFKTNLPEKLRLLWINEQRIKEGKGWLPESEWQRYLQGETPKSCACGKNEKCSCNKILFTFEPRFGIGIARDKRNTQTGMLYRATFVRLHESVALWAKVEGIDFKQQGFLRFGGEGRVASYESIDPLPSFASYIPKLENRFKVVLISPAWFSGGWKPQDDWSKIFGIEVSLVAIALPRAQKFGGFDLAKGEPKPIRNFVPPGSVYFFEGDEKIEIPENFRFTETPKEVVKSGGDWGKIGFGVCLIGKW